MDKLGLTLKSRFYFSRWLKPNTFFHNFISDTVSEICNDFLYNSQFWPIKKLQKVQLKKTQQLIKDAYQFVPFYRFWFDSHGINPKDIRNLEDIKFIPPVSKTDFKQFNLDYVTDRNIDRSRYFGISTSGSTHEPFKFFLDKQYDPLRQAIFRRFLKWCNIPFNNKKILIADPELFHRISGDLNISIFDLLNKPRQIIDEIKKFNGDVLIGYASGLQELAMTSLKNDISMKFSKIVSFAEQLSENSRYFFEKTFHGEVYNFYGAAEFGIIGQECALHDGFHINEEGLIVEVEPSADFENGYGEVVITSLMNEVMPFIRYYIGDLGHIDVRPCPCGILLRKIRIIGRTSVVFQSSKRKIHEFEFNNVLKSFSDRITAFQIKKGKGNAVIIKIIASHPSNDLKNAIIQGLKDKIGGELNFVVEYVSSIDRLPSGKIS